jgi:hypothetical protein
MRAFWGILSLNLIQKFKTQSLAVTLHRREHWRDNVTMTLCRQERWRHLGPSLGAPTICMTSLRFNDIYHNAAMYVIQPYVNRKKYDTVGLHVWQRQKFCRNVWIKLFSRVWNRFQWCSTDRSPNYLGCERAAVETSITCHLGGPGLDSPVRPTSCEREGNSLLQQTFCPVQGLRQKKILGTYFFYKFSV